MCRTKNSIPDQPLRHSPDGPDSRTGHEHSGGRDYKELNNTWNNDVKSRERREGILLLVTRRELYGARVVGISRHREHVTIRAGVRAAGERPVAVSVSETGALPACHSWYH